MAPAGAGQEEPRGVVLDGFRILEVAEHTFVPAASTLEHNGYLVQAHTASGTLRVGRGH